MSERAAVVMTKLPRPDRVKTRLGLPGEIASQLAIELLQAVLTLVDRAAERLPFERILAVALGPEDSSADTAALVAPGWRLIVQRGEDLGERIQAAAEDAGAAKVVVLGADAPTLPPARIVEAFAALERAPAVFGPTEDGGYYLVGLAAPAPALFAGIPWSTSQVMAETRKAAVAARIGLEELPAWYDVDRLEDLARAQADGFSCSVRSFVLRPAPHGKDSS